MERVKKSAEAHSKEPISKTRTGCSRNGARSLNYEGKCLTCPS